MSDKKLTWFEKLRFRVRAGYRIDDDNYQEDAVIRYKDIYIQMLKGDNGYDVSWSDSPSPHAVVREMWQAVPPEASDEA